MDYNPCKKLEEQLREVGKELANCPTQVDELLSLLNKAGKILEGVGQSPTSLISNAYAQCLKALVDEPLLKHKDADVQVAVAYCINEVIRITAPEAPYSDDKMKEVFQPIVSSFENLSDMSSRSYEKRVYILETVAKVKSWILMLDLECNGLLSEMFHHFLSSIRDFHPEKIFIFMETIMTHVLEESDDDSLYRELLTPILASLKRDNDEEICTSARKLGESVLSKCAVKIKPHLRQAVKSLGLPLDGYSEIVATICNESDGGVDLNNGNVFVQKANKIKLTCLEPEDVVNSNSNSSLLNSAIPYFLHPIKRVFSPVKEKPEAAELVWHDDEIVAIDKNDRAADDFCFWNSGQITEKAEAAELVSRRFGHDDEIVLIEKNDQAADDFCIRNFGQISEKTEVAELVSQQFGRDDEIVVIDKTDQAVDDFCIKNFGQISERPEAAERLCRLFGQDIEIVAIDKNGRAADEIAMQIDNTSSGDNAPAFGSQSRITTPGRTTKSKNDDEQSTKLEETNGILLGSADETAMPASKRRRNLTTEDIQTENNENEQQSIKLEKSIGILVGALKDVAENKKLPIPVEELWGFIHEMKLDEDIAGDAFVFLLDRPVQLKGLISTPIGIRKSILMKMMMRDAKYRN